MDLKSELIDAINYLIYQHEDMLKSSQVNVGIKGPMGSPSLDIDKHIIEDLQVDLELVNAGENMDELATKYHDYLNISKAA